MRHVTEVYFQIFVYFCGYEQILEILCHFSVRKRQLFHLIWSEIHRKIRSPPRNIGHDECYEFSIPQRPSVLL